MPTRPLLLGHRGARAVKTVPENTIASFDLSLAHGCDGFEFDVRLTADGQAVICHDPRIQGAEIAHTLASKLPGLARLEEVLVRYQKTAFLDMELKVAGLEKITANLFVRFPPGRGCVVSSFLPEALQALRPLAAQLSLGLICESERQLAVWHHLPVDHVIPHHSLVTHDLIRELHDAGKRVFVWTVNQAAGMRRMAEWGADAIVSDEAELLVRTLGG